MAEKQCMEMFCEHESQENASTSLNNKLLYAAFSKEYGVGENCNNDKLELISETSDYLQLVASYPDDSPTGINNAVTNPAVLTV